MHPRPSLHFLALLALGFAAAAPAQDADPIEIQADTAELDRAAGRSVYRGDVVLTRGGLELRGSELVVTREGDDRITAVLTGDPARLRQAPADEGTAPITGAAQRMTYTTAREHVELAGEAMIERGGNTVRGDTIAHDLASGRTEARRAEDGERVRITLDPPQKQDPAEDGDGS